MQKAITFVKESYTELSKATWLTRQQVVQSTMFVFLVVIVLAIYVNSVDFCLTKIMEFAMGGR
jgi:preprotein translocase SecE subunit